MEWWNGLKWNGGMGDYVASTGSYMRSNNIAMQIYVQATWFGAYRRGSDLALGECCNCYVYINVVLVALLAI